jgi:hypothetical protein
LPHAECDQPVMHDVKNPEYIAALPGTGTNVNVYVTSQCDSSCGQNTGSIQKMTVSSTGTLLTGPTAVISGLNSPLGIAVTPVPTGATTGKIKVVTPKGTLSSNVPFRVTS